MTTMIDRFFGMPQDIVRSGHWARMKPSVKSLYVGLLYESERCSTRQLDRSDRELCQLTGISKRALRDARIKLQEFGLIEVHWKLGGRHRYIVCDPKTGKPYPGDPKRPIPYVRKPRSGRSGNPRNGTDETQVTSSQTSSENVPKPTVSEPEVCGVKVSFD